MNTNYRDFVACYSKRNISYAWRCPGVSKVIPHIKAAEIFRRLNSKYHTFYAIIV